MKKIAKTPLAVVLAPISQAIVLSEYKLLNVKWALSGHKKPNQAEIDLVKENITFIFKSFERQNMAKRLYKNIQSYYPGVKVIIADDSSKPLRLEGKCLEVLQLPFNSGLSYGINRALEKVTTPFLVRMDDDELLTPLTRFHEQLRFLMDHPEVDLVGVLPYNLPTGTSLERVAEEYYKHSMSDAPKKLKIPHLTAIDETHRVFGKVPNIFIARTDKIKEVGYDDNIRMIDHHDFFRRAAGNMVSVLDSTAFVVHYHNPFDQYYQRYRSDFQGDARYIRNKIRQTETVDKQHIYEMFLEAFSASLRGESVSWTELSLQEWKGLFRVARQQQVMPMIYQAVYNCPAVEKIPDIMEKLGEKARKEVLKQVRKTDGFLKLYKKLCDAGIKPLVVKGIVCRSLYAQPEHRSSVDEDMLISEEHFALAHQIMMGDGLQLMEPEQDIEAADEVSYVKKGTRLYFEVHKRLFPTDSESCGEYNRFFEHVYENAIQIEIQGVPIYTMGHTDHMLYLMCHAFKHFLGPGFGLRLACDISLFANTYGHEIDWSYVYECCKEIRAEKFMAAVFRLGQKYCGFDAKKACYPTRWQAIEVDESSLLQDMLEGGVLGASEMSRLHSSTITMNAVKAQKKGEKAKASIWKSVFPPVEYLVGKYKYLEKHPYLLPIAWVSRIFKYGNELRGSTKNSPSRSIEIGNRRVELLKKYGIVEED